MTVAVARGVRETVALRTRKVEANARPNIPPLVETLILPAGTDRKGGGWTTTDAWLQTKSRGVVSLHRCH